MKPFDVAKILNDAGVMIRSYSGRGMYGAECLSIQDEPLEAIKQVVDTRSIETLEELDEFLEVLETPNRDQMGLGLVYYWPRIKWTPEIAELVGPGTFEPWEE